MKEHLLDKLGIENIVAREEIAHHEQFLLWPQSFQKTSAVEALKSIYMKERAKTITLTTRQFWQRGS